MTSWRPLQLTSRLLLCAGLVLWALLSASCQGSDHRADPDTGPGDLSLDTTLDDTGDDGPSDVSGDGDDTADSSDVSEPIPPFFVDGQVDVSAAVQWVRARQYLGWAAASEVRPSTQPEGGSRPFVNAALATSLQAGNQTHPIGAMGVREIYDTDLRTLKIINLLVKQQSTEQPGVGEWLFIEVTDLSLGGGLPPALVDPPECMACHSAPADRVISTWPL